MSTTIEQLPIAQLKPAKDNARRDVGNIDELAASIRAMGLLEPIVATRQNGHHLIVCGARRYAAAKKAGLADVPVIVREFSEAERVEAMLIENLQRENLSPLEEAQAYSRLVGLGHTQRQLAERVGCSQSHVSKRLALLDLPAKALKELDSGGITLEDAQDLAKLREHPERMAHVVKELGTRYHSSVERLVEGELNEVKREQKIEAETAAIKAEGIALRQMKRTSQYHWTPPKGTMVVGDSWEGLDIQVKRHAKEPCHAAAVDLHGDRVYLCTDPARHANESPKAERKTKTDREAEKRRAHEKELKAARAARHAHVGSSVLGGKVPKGEAVTLVVEGLLMRATREAHKIACQLLGLEPIKTKGQYSTSIDYDTPLLKAAAKSERDLLRVGMALSIAGVEEFLGGNWHTWSERDKAYFQLLERHGYQPSAAEKRELSGKAPRQTRAY